MSTPQHHEEDDFRPSETPGYKPNAVAYSADQYKEMDKEDESLARWKESLLGKAPNEATQAQGPLVTVLAMELRSPSLNGKIVELKLTDDAEIAKYKKNPINIKEGVEYNVGIKFKVNFGICSGVRYLQVVKRAGVKVDKLEQMLGSYAAREEPFFKNFDPEESPSGMLARSGTYSVTSRVMDDDGHVYKEFEWSFKLTKEW